MKQFTMMSVDLEKMGQDFLKETLMLSVFFKNLFIYLHFEHQSKLTDGLRSIFRRRLENRNQNNLDR